EPEQRDHGLLAISERTQNVTDSGFESYANIANDVAAQVVDEQHRSALIGCKPQLDTARDDACAGKFFGRVGPLLYRRAVTDEELHAQVAVAGMAADKLHDFYSGISFGLVQMLISPDFLFRYRMMEPDPAHPGQERMNAYSKASELSFFL